MYQLQKYTRACFDNCPSHVKNKIKWAWELITRWLSADEIPWKMNDGGKTVKATMRKLTDEDKPWYWWQPLFYEACKSEPVASKRKWETLHRDLVRKKASPLEELLQKVEPAMQLEVTRLLHSRRDPAVVPVLTYFSHAQKLFELTESLNCDEIKRAHNGLFMYGLGTSMD